MWILRNPQKVVIKDLLSAACIDSSEENTFKKKKQNTNQLKNNNYKKIYKLKKARN